MYGWRSALKSCSLAPLNSTVGISFTFGLPSLMEMSNALNPGCISFLAEKRKWGYEGKYCPCFFESQWNNASKQSLLTVPPK